MGVVGEEDSGLLVYIGGSSRLLNQPLAIVARGRTASGKTHLIKRVSVLMPPETLIDATSLTPNALYRLQPGELPHKILMVGERRHRQDDEATDATAALRQLLSEGRIAKLCPVKSEGGWQTVLIEQEGPIAYFETTTSRSIFAEDLNRMLQVTTDESESQTRAVMLAAARRYDLSESSAGREQVIERHREFQQALQYVDVRIPYAGALAEGMPAGQVECRRIIWQVLQQFPA